jgi:SAM-dependent methyltransferase
MAKKGKKKKRKTTRAALADRHQLYELSVQCPESEVDFVEATFKRLRKRKARVMREDFCGTANVCREWVKRSPKNHAIGVDLDEEVLAWGEANTLAILEPEARERITLLRENVLDAVTDQVDLISAMNFSYWLLRERKDLLRYFRQVRKSLRDDGVFFLDAYGGYDAHREIEETRDIDDGGEGFEYVWNQESFDPVTHTMHCSISFRFPDGSKLPDAYKYSWRLWTLPEIRDLLEEAGFARVTVYWQGWDDDGEPDGDFQPVNEGVADAGWIAYITAEK